MGNELPVIDSLDELTRLSERESGLYLRYSEGPEADASHSSRDTESGLDLPGLSVVPIDPESWWSRPREDWLSRQLCQYKQLKDKNGDRFAWLLRGELIARGPDSEPLLADVEPVARLSEGLLDEAEAHYQEHFDAGQGPED